VPEQPTDHLLACCLNRVEMEEREQRWQRLSESALLEASREADRALLRYSDGPEVAAELRELVRLERECCPFLGFSISEHGGTIELRVDGPPEAATMIDSFAAAGSPAAPVSRSS
jgi:hypothetical protein